jgi:Pentapeptide repeats (8 copies)
MLERLNARLSKNDRAIKLLAFNAGWVGVLLLTDWYFSDSWARLTLFFPPADTTPNVQAWTALVYAIALIVGLPSAFLLWHWRDKNVRDQLVEQQKQVENARRDINLKEFQEVCLRAAGAMDTKLDDLGRETLQIAALHQLRAFLRGDYGESFKRPAFELFCAGLAASADKVGTQTVQSLVANWKDGDPPIRTTVRSALLEMRGKLDWVSRVRLSVIHDEWQAMFLAGYPLINRNFDLLELPAGARLDGLDLTDASFVGAKLTGVRFQGANLRRAHFHGTGLAFTYFKEAKLRDARLEGADLGYSHLEGADLFAAHLEGADMVRARLKGAELNFAHLQGAQLRVAQCEGADLKSAKFNNATILDAGWKYLEEQERDVKRQQMIDLGAINVDALPTPVKEYRDGIDDDSI